MDESSCALWLQEVESVDYWGPTFRAIYEGGAQEEFLQRLEKRIEEHDTEIEKMCNHHYQVSSLKITYINIAKSITFASSMMYLF